MEKYESAKPFFIPTPSSIAALDIPLAHKAVSGSIFARTALRNRTGFVAMRVSWIIEDWNIDEKSVTRALKWLKENGYIEVKRTRFGNMVKWIGDTSSDYPDESDTAKCGITQQNQSGKMSDTNPTKSRIPIRQIVGSQSDKLSDALPISGTHIENLNRKQQPSRACVRTCEAPPESETPVSPVVVFDSVSQSPLLNPNSYTAKPRREYVVFTQTQANLAAQLLGASGEDAKAPSVFTPEQSAKEGFIEYCIKSAIDRRGKVSGSAFAYLKGIVANSWNEGKWVDPAIEAERAKQAEQAERAARLERLIKRMS